jgi:hypothetical protein
MDLRIIYNEVEYLIKDIEHEADCPGDRDTPPCPGGVTGWGDVYWNGVKVSEVFNSLVNDDDFLEQLEMIVEEEIQDRYEDYLVDKYDDY